MTDERDVKQYLRIPYDDDDVFITNAVKQGYAYLKNAIEHYSEMYGTNEEFTDLCDMWVLTQWAPWVYDQREGMLEGKTELNYGARSLLTQLQTYAKGE